MSSTCSLGQADARIQFPTEDPYKQSLIVSQGAH